MPLISERGDHTRLRQTEIFQKIRLSIADPVATSDGFQEAQFFVAEQCARAAEAEITRDGSGNKLGQLFHADGFVEQFASLSARCSHFGGI